MPGLLNAVNPISEQMAAAKSLQLKDASPSSSSLRASIHSVLSDVLAVVNSLKGNGWIYRQQLFKKRKWACILTTVASLYGLLAAFLVAEFEVRCLEGSEFDPGRPTETLQIQYDFEADPPQSIIDSTNVTDLKQYHQFASAEMKDEFIKSRCWGVRYADYFRWTLTASTLMTLFFTLMYQYYEIRIFKFDNSLSPSVILISRDLYMRIALEMVIVGTHPVWLPDQTLWFMYYYPLYFIMVLRIVYMLRIFMLHSHMFDSTKVQSVATLNKINIGALTKENMRLIVRTFMGDYGGRIMLVGVLVNWGLNAWLIRLSEAQWNFAQGSTDGVADMGDALWMVPITLTTIGYGDFYPRSTLGRIWCIWLALAGCVSTAILVNIMTDTLSMTRRERLLFRVLNSDNLRNSLKDKAAVVLQRTWRAHKKGKRVLAKPTMTRPTASKTDVEDGTKGVGCDPSEAGLCLDAQILESVTRFRKLRVKTMFIEDEMTDAVDLGIQQSQMLKQFNCLEDTVESMENKLDLILEALGAAAPETAGDQ